MKSLVVVLAIVGACSSAGCALMSRLYWGYWVFPPSANWIASSIASVERFTTFWCCSPNQSGHRALQDAAQTEFYGAGHELHGNLPKALVRLGLEPNSPEAVPTALLMRIRGALDSRGALVEGKPGYSHAKELWGHVAVGRNAQGSVIVLAALIGGEVSNDHHPYYEAAFATSPTGELSLLRVRQYWFDVAGLEGIAHWLGAFVGCIVGVALTARLSRRNRRAA